MKNIEIEGGIELSNGMQIYFLNEKAPYEVKAVNDNFAICTRDLHRWYDSELIKYRVEMNAYISFTEAYKDLRKEKIYTIIDLKRNIRGPHDLVFQIYNLKNQVSIKSLLKDLDNGIVEISSRNKINYNLDFERTLNGISFSKNRK